MVGKVKVKWFWLRIWKQRIIRLLTGELRYASYIRHQVEKEVDREERRLRGQGKTGLELENEIERLFQDVLMVWDDYRELLSKKWVRKAFELSVPIPPRPPQDAIQNPSGYWTQHILYKSWFLSEKGVHHVRSEVRKVQKSKFDLWFPWLTFGGAIIAIVISLLSLVFNFIL